MTWLDELRSVIRKDLATEVGQKFSLEDLYEYIDDFQKAHPTNNHVRETMRDQLQLLRDLDEVEFVDDEGTYRRTA